MAVVAVSNSNNRRDAAEATTNWTKLGGAGKPQNEPDFFYQGTQAISSKVGTTIGGQTFTDPTPVDMTVAADAVVMIKALWTNKDVLVATPAASIRIGSALAALNQYFIADDGTDAAVVGAAPEEKIYPAKGGFLIIPIDPNIEEWVDVEVTASPTLTAVDIHEIEADFSAASKSENVVIDAVDIGNGLWLVGGDSTDPDGTFQDFVDHDEGTIGNRFGHVSTIDGVIYVFGKLVIGASSVPTATATVFTDKLQTLVWPGGRVDSGWNGIDFDLSPVTTVIDLEDITFIGRGRDRLKHFFDTRAAINSGTEVFTIVDHGFKTGDAVVYDVSGGAAVTGLTDAAIYWVRALTDDTFTLHFNSAQVLRDGAFQNTNLRTVTADTVGQSHSFQRTPDTRPDFEAGGVSGLLTFTRCTFVNIRQVFGEPGVSFIECVLVGHSFMSLAGGSFTDCVVADALIAEDQFGLRVSDPEAVSGCTFIRTDTNAQRGHAVQMDTVGTYDHVGNVYTGWGVGVAQFEADSGVDTGTDVITTNEAHGFVDGDEVFYGDEGGTQINNLLDGARYYVNAITTTTLTLHNTKLDAEGDLTRINITAGGAETHALYSGQAAIQNSSGGLITLNVSGGGSTPSFRNTPGSSTVVNNTVTLLVTIKDLLGNLVNEDVNVRIELDPAGTLVVEGNTTAGVYSVSFNYTADLDVKIIPRLKGFRFAAAFDTITTDGLSVPFSLTPDPTVDLP